MRKVNVARKSDFTLFVNDAEVRHEWVVSQQLLIDRWYNEVRIGGGQRPDPLWEFVDAAGHWHAVAERSLPAEHWYPTLRRERTPEGYCESCEGDHTDSYWACVLCGERIEPATVPVPGSTTFALAGVPGWRVEVKVCGEGVNVFATEGQRLATLIADPWPAVVRIEHPMGPDGSATRVLFGVASVRIDSLAVPSPGDGEYVTAHVILNGTHELGERARA